MTFDWLTDPHILWLAVYWCFYFALHSLLASHAVKRRVMACCPRLAPRYRLLYTLVATVLLLPALYLLYTTPGPWLWRWDGVAGWIADALALAALVGFVHSARAYDMASFLGVRPSEPIVTPERAEPLRFSASHRWVRHPWYFYGLILLWTRDMNAAMFVTAVLATGYIILGTWLEERKLVAELGEAYREYQRQVPALIPLPWKRLKKQGLSEPARPGRR